MKPSKDRLLELVSFVEPGSDDVTYTHAVFAQCFLPIRKLPNGGKRYEVRHGRAALLITAGDLLNPTTQQFVQMDVPSGSAARIALAHINNHIIRCKTVEEALVVPMGESLRDFMDYQSIAIGGKNGKEITRQIHNLAAARIVLGVWTDNRARQVNAQIADFDRLLARARPAPAHPLAALDARFGAVRAGDPRALRAARHPGPRRPLREHPRHGHLYVALLPPAESAVARGGVRPLRRPQADLRNGYQGRLQVPPGLQECP